MPELADLQRTIAATVLAPGATAPDDLFAAGGLGARALRIHRNTVLGALADALGHGFPTVRSLIGAEMLDHAAVAYAAAHPPRDPRLSRFGEAFADFLELWPLTYGLPWLADVARLDAAIALAASGPVETRRYAIDLSVSLLAPASLAAVELAFPVDRVRAAVEAGEDIPALFAADRSSCWIAVWRASQGVAVRRLGAVAGRFLTALLAGRTADDALNAASQGLEPNAAALAVQAEVFAAPFITVVPTPVPENSP
jgi:hypothetical protein